MRDPRREPDPGHVWELQQTRVRRYGTERFDRLRFARRVLDALDPPALDVLLYEGTRDIRIERGHAWNRPSGYLWAMISIPAAASREEIVYALLELIGADPAAFLVDALLALDDPG